MDYVAFSFDIVIRLFKCAYSFFFNRGCGATALLGNHA